MVSDRILFNLTRIEYLSADCHLYENMQKLNSGVVEGFLLFLVWDSIILRLGRRGIVYNCMVLDM